MGCCCCRLSVFNRVSDFFEDFVSSGFSPTSPAPTITFDLRFGSHGTITMFVRADADATGERFSADVRIRRNDSTGTQVYAPSAVIAGIEWYWDPGFPAFTNFYSARPLEPLNLDSGTYWAQLEIDTLGTNIDLTEQWIRFGP